MGYKNSAQVAMSTICRLFSKLKCCLPYLDDLSIASPSAKKHLEEDLPNVFAGCSRHNILISPKKCDFFRYDVRVLGYQISWSSEMVAAERREKIKTQKIRKKL